MTLACPECKIQARRKSRRPCCDGLCKDNRGDSIWQCVNKECDIDIFRRFNDGYVVIKRKSSDDHKHSSPIKYKW